MLTPFITNEQFFTRYDYRWIGQNLKDDGTDATYVELTTVTLNPTDPGTIIYSFAFEASEMLMGAAAVGARYSENDIRTYGGYLLLRICADLMLAPVLQRRNRALTDEAELSKSYDEAQQYLELLRRGERIFFMVPGVPEAGLPATSDMCPRPGIDAPLITGQSVRFFGLPGQCIGPGGGGGCGCSNNWW